MLASEQAPLLASRPHQRRLLKQPRAFRFAEPARRTRQFLPSNDAFSRLASTNNDDVSTTTSCPSPTSSSSPTIAATKASLIQASPAARKGDPVAIAAVVSAVKELSSLSLEKASSSSSSSSSSSPTPPPRFPVPPEPSTWETLYTDAKVGSNGKVGPLQGEARQLFLSSEKGSRFINRVAFPTVSFPLLRADFSGSWLPKPNREDRLEVIFEDNSFYIFGIRVGGGVFPPPPQKGSLKGHWVMKFADDEIRAFVTNKMSLVVLGRVRSEE